MRHFTHLIFLVGFCIFTISGCKDDSTPPTQAIVQSDELQSEAENYIDCPEVRPEMCTQIYDPVCGLVDSGIRCITTPCPSVIHKTLGNACTACSDEKVTGYFDGECPVETEQSSEAEQSEQTDSDESTKEPELSEEE